MLGDEVATFLASQGLGLSVAATSANAVFAGPFPPECNDTATCIIEYGGLPPVEAFSPSQTAALLEQTRFQVLCRDRSDNLQTCRTLANSIYKVLRHYSGTMGTAAVSYPFVDAVTPVFFLKFDENQRGIYACNYEAFKVESTG